MSRQAKVLLVVSVGSFMAFLDSTVVAIAFPSIEADFASTSRAAISWVLDGYFIAFAALLVLFGRTADRLGRRRLFLSGLALFSAASLLCAVAPSAGVLIAARVAQAAGAAMVVPAAQGMLLAEVPPEQWKRALGVLAGIIGLAAAAGPVVGGLLVDELDWRWIFWVNLPVCIGALVYGARLLRESRPAASGPSPDALGALLQAASVSLVVLALLKSDDWGWGDLRTVACLAASAVALAVFLRRSARHRAPVFDLALFRDRVFRVGNAASTVYAVGFYAVVVNSVLFLATVWNYSPIEVGLAIAPGPFMGIFSAVIAGRLAERVGFMPLAVGGAAIGSAGAVFLASTLGGTPDFGEWLPGMLLLGTGNGMALTAMITASITSVPPTHFGVGSALNAALRQVGGAIGIAALVAIVGTPSPDEALSAFHSGFVLSAIAAAAASVLAFGLGRADPEPAAAPLDGPPTPAPAELAGRS
jgi:EmrB/QacA subfamily drug resistance transporter